MSWHCTIQPTLATLVSLDGVGEYNPFVASILERPGGGIRVEVSTNPIDFETLPVTGVTRLCFDAGLLQLPAGQTTLQVRDSSESYEDRTEFVRTFQRDSASSLQTSTQAPGAPRIDSVHPQVSKAGDEITIEGSGFDPDPGANRVTVEGNSQVEASVLEASSTQLQVQLPDQVVSGDLVVEVGGSASNPYSLTVPFGPGAGIQFGSLAAGASTTMELRQTQKVGQIGIYKMQVNWSEGEWLTDGFVEGQIIGTLDQRLILPDSQVDFLSASARLVVRSSTSDVLEVDVIPEDDDDPSDLITITRGGALLVELPELDFTGYLFVDLEFTLDFSEPIVQLPDGSGTGFQALLKWTSLPERTAIEATTIVVEKRLEFETN